MDDALAVAADELGGIDAADEQVPGVEAPAGVGQPPASRSISAARLDLGADVRVQREREPVLLDDRARSPARLAREPVQASSSSGRGGDQPSSATTAATNSSAPALGEDGGAALGRGARGERGRARAARAARTRRPAAGRGGRARSRIACRLVRQIADRAELGAAQAELRHLGEHPLGRQHPAPAGHLAHAPRDGSARQATDGASRRIVGRRRRIVPGVGLFHMG